MLLVQLLVVLYISASVQASTCPDIASPTIINISGNKVTYTWKDTYRFSKFALQYLSCDKNIANDAGLGYYEGMEGCPADIWIDVPGPTKKATFQPCSMYSFRMMAFCIEDTIYSKPAHYYYQTKVCESCMKEPVSQLSWLQELVDQYTNQSNLYELYTTCLNGQSLFNLSAVDCCNQESIIYDESGNVWCNDSSTDLFCDRYKTLSRSKLIWTNKNNLLDTYPWLNVLVDGDQCSEGTIIDQYAFGVYKFLHIKYPNGEGDLYFENGTFYCADAANYSCIKGYNFGDPVATLVCGENSGGEPVDPQNQSLFNTYDWIEGMVNPSNCTSTITEYQYSTNHYFIFIETVDEANLYYQDGTLYCTNSLTYSCLDAYGLSTPNQFYQCKNSANKKATIKEINRLHIYPNPSTGIFNVNVSKINASQTKIYIADIQGKQLRHFNINEAQQTIQLDLSDLEKGIYLIRLQSEHTFKTSKIIIH